MPILQSGKAKKVKEAKEDTVTLGPTVREGEHVFGVAHIFASFNDTFVVSGSSSIFKGLGLRSIGQSEDCMAGN